MTIREKVDYIYNNYRNFNNRHDWKYINLCDFIEKFDRNGKLLFLFRQSNKLFFYSKHSNNCNILLINLLYKRIKEEKNLWYRFLKFMRRVRYDN